MDTDPSPVGRAAAKGVAIVSVLLVVALATLIVSALFFREQIAVRSVENRLLLSQGRWIERAALDWAKVILLADGRSGPVDHLQEPWATPVAETQLDETVTAGARLREGERAPLLMGQMFDAQGRMNLTNLELGGKPSEVYLDALRRLLEILRLPVSLADTLTERVLLSRQPLVDGKPAPPTMLPPQRLEDLLGSPGFDEETVAALVPFVVFLPRVTPLNLNTAPAEVIGAMVPGIDLAAAQRFVAKRERTFFSNLAAAGTQFDNQPTLSSQLFSVGSSYFLVHGMVRFGRVESVSDTLLERSGQKVEVVWQRRY